MIIYFIKKNLKWCFI